MTLPLKLAFTGPTLAVTLAVISVSDRRRISSQPGMHCLRISGSLSALMIRAAAEGTISICALRFWTTSLTVTRRPLKDCVSLAISSAILAP